MSPKKVQIQWIKDRSVDEVIERQTTHQEPTDDKENQTPLDGNEELEQILFKELEQLTKKKEELELENRHLEGKDLENLSLEELTRLEQTLENTLRAVKAQQREEERERVRELSHQQTMDYQFADEAGEQKVTDEQRALTDLANQKEGLDD